jgi:hypothetical protein
MKARITLYLLATLALHADMTVVQEVSSTDPLTGPAAQEMTIMVSGGRMRIEHPQAGILTIPDQNKNIMIMHAQKMYMVMPSMESMMTMSGSDKADASAFAPDRISWSRTGQKEKNAGYDAEQWIGKDSATGKPVVEVWAGGKRELINEYVDSLGKMGSGMLASFAAQLKSGAGEGPFKYGYPLKTVTYNDLGSPGTVTLVKKLDSGPVDPKWFAPPPGYQEMQMPQGMTMPQGQPPMDE